MNLHSRNQLCFTKSKASQQVRQPPISSRHILCSPSTNFELLSRSWEMSSTSSLSEDSWAIDLYSLQATSALAMVSSPRCQRKSAIFCRFISTAHTISSWKGYWKRLTSGSSTSISISSSFFFFFFFPLVGGSSSWEEKKKKRSHQFLTAYLTIAPCTEQVLRGHINT